MRVMSYACPFSFMVTSMSCCSIRWSTTRLLSVDGKARRSADDFPASVDQAGVARSFLPKRSMQGFWKVLRSKPTLLQGFLVYDLASSSRRKSFQDNRVHIRQVPVNASIN